MNIPSISLKVCQIALILSVVVVAVVTLTGCALPSGSDWVRTSQDRQAPAGQRIQRKNRTSKQSYFNDRITIWYTRDDEEE